jgi:excinuclease ABC subunit A
MIRLDEIDQHKLDKRCNANHWSNCCKSQKNSIIVLQMQQTAFYEGNLSSTRIKTDKKFSYSNNFELDGITF